jgi:hypothetical protein
MALSGTIAPSLRPGEMSNPESIAQVRSPLKAACRRIEKGALRSPDGRDGVRAG